MLLEHGCGTEMYRVNRNVMAIHTLLGAVTYEETLKLLDRLQYVPISYVPFLLCSYLSLLYLEILGENGVIFTPKESIDEMVVNIRNVMNVMNRYSSTLLCLLPLLHGILYWFFLHP